MKAFTVSAASAVSAAVKSADFTDSVDSYTTNLLLELLIKMLDKNSARTASSSLIIYIDRNNLYQISSLSSNMSYDQMYHLFNTSMNSTFHS